RQVHLLDHQWLAMGVQAGRPGPGRVDRHAPHPPGFKSFVTRPGIGPNQGTATGFPLSRVAGTPPAPVTRENRLPAGPAPPGTLPAEPVPLAADALRPPVGTGGRRAGA